ncbi:MAG: NAD(P)-dependent glycerol-1-phosphate dehydrogenase [Hyperthermus sp.]|nr:MAG: NAD(P)-dependent glycerol-1-phosphate dehydrogenase [Hyperthermus sp.]
MIHGIELPRRIVIGEDALEELQDIIKLVRAGSDGLVLVVTGPNVWARYGGRFMDVVEGVGVVKVVEVSEASIAVAERVADGVRGRDVSVIVGFGGGKSIDVAKYVGHVLSKPVVSVPTSPSHDGISSPFVSLKGSDKPYSIKASAPAALVADVNVLSSAPLRLIRAGAGDLIAKLTAVRDWKLAHKLKGEYYGEYAAKLALLSAKHVIEYASEIGRGSKAGVRVLVEGLISSGVAMCIAGSTRPASGSEHLFSHALDMLVPGAALHGEQVALGTVMMMYLHGGNWLRVKRTLKLVGLPSSAKELGIPGRVIVDALVMAHRIRPERYTILGDSGLTREAALRLALNTGVIDQVDGV